MRIATLNIHNVFLNNKFVWIEAKNGAALVDHIYMDAMGFGMGCSCLQLTFQACNVNEARRLYDALVPLTPLLVRVQRVFPAISPNQQRNSSR